MLTRPLLLFAATASSVDGFAFNIFSAFQADPMISKLRDAKLGEKFNIRMDIGQKDETHIFLDGLCVEMLREAAPKSDKVGMPGADGPHPKTSTGALALNVLSVPSFIDMFGTQRVRFEKACWELIWKKDRLCGSIICGFNLPMGAKRNGANLPAGRLYLSFPVWSQEGLAVRQAEKFEAELKAREFAKEKDEELEKFSKEKNLFKKAMHYRNAVAAVEKIDFTGVRWLNEIPDDTEVTPIGNGLLLNTKGSVWNKAGDYFGAKHTHLGNAVLAPFSEEERKDALRP